MRSGILSLLLAVSFAAHAAKPVPNPRFGVDVKEDAEKLPPSYRGHDCRSVLTALGKAKLSKDEFETTSAFNDRMRAFERTTSVPGIREGSLVAAVRNIDAEAISYDADAGILSVPVGHLPIPTSSLGRAKVGFIADRKITKSKNYTASNAFGKTVRVSSRQESVCAIGFTNMYYELGKGVEHISISSTPDEARRSKANLSVLYLGRLTQPYVEDLSYYSKATIDDPTELTLAGGILVAEIRETVVFDNRSGKVLHRTKDYGEKWITESDIKK